MKYAIPLHVQSDKSKFALVVGPKSYQVVTAPFVLRGMVADDVLSQLEQKYKEVVFSEELPDWHARVDEDAPEKTEADANEWFFEIGNLVYQEDKRSGFVPKGGIATTGPIFQRGSEKTLTSLVQGVATWIGNKDLPIEIEGPIVEDGEFSVKVFPDGPPAEIGKMLVQIAYRQNSFYGTRWENIDGKEPHLQRAWKEQGITMKFVNPPESEAHALRASMIAWARGMGIDLPDKPEAA